MPCDVVVVAEFERWEHAVESEIRLLFFLASWIEAGGANLHSATSLHLACIGQPPHSVRELASVAGASIEVHAPLVLGSNTTVNRLRGLETPSRTGCLFLLEPETIILQPIPRWINVQTSYELLLVPTIKPAGNRFDWSAIYAAAGLTPPVKKIDSLRAQLQGATEPMLPFYQPRCLWTRSPGKLREAWARQFEFTQDERVALSLALAEIGAPGRMPFTLSARMTHWEAGALLPGDTQLFQASSLLSGITDAGSFAIALTILRTNWKQRFVPESKGKFFGLASAPDSVRRGSVVTSTDYSDVTSDRRSSGVERSSKSS